MKSMYMIIYLSITHPICPAGTGNIISPLLSKGQYGRTGKAADPVMKIILLTYH
jgi:hypothetical protein